MSVVSSQGSAVSDFCSLSTGPSPLSWLDAESLFLERRPRDDVSLNFIRAAEQAQGAHVTIVARDGVFVREAVAAVHLQHFIGGIFGHAPAEVLGHRRGPAKFLT